MVTRIGLVRYFLVFIGNMDLEQLSRNSGDKKEPVQNNISIDTYENFLKEQVKTLENLLKEECTSDIDERVLQAKIIAYQECYIQYLILKRGK